MKTPDSADKVPTQSTSDTTPKPETETVAGAVRALLQHGTIEDATDRRLVAEATAFIEAPTGNLSDIVKHLSNIGEVLGGYMMQGADAPPQVDAMHAHLLGLQCQYHIAAVKAELKQASPDLSKIQRSLFLASEPAKNLSKGYKDDTLLKELQLMEQGIDLQR